MAFTYSTSECVPRLYPISTFLGNLTFEGDEHEPLMISRGNYKRAQWGDSTSPVIIDNNTYPSPSGINMLWIALTEVKLYWLDAPIDSKKIENTKRGASWLPSFFKASALVRQIFREKKCQS